MAGGGGLLKGAVAATVRPSRHRLTPAAISSYARVRPSAGISCDFPQGFIYLRSRGPVDQLAKRHSHPLAR